MTPDGDWSSPDAPQQVRADSRSVTATVPPHGRILEYVPHLYILECADGSLYVGSTIDLERRVAQHQRGDGSAYTRRRLPVLLVFSKEFARIDDAFALEKQVQGWSRAKRRALIEGRLASLPRLSRKRRSRGIVEFSRAAERHLPEVE